MNDSPYQIEPNKGYNHHFLMAFLGINRDTLVKDYIKPEKIRFEKRGRSYFFLGQWLIDDILNCGGEE